jgi:hypothetical protein
MDDKALLGSLPGLRIEIRNDGRGLYKQDFISPMNPRGTHLDPRPGPLPENWKGIVAPDCLWPEKQVDAFRNTTTGEIMHAEQRLLPDA